MKKTKLKLIVLLLSVILLAGCGSQMERDAKRLAKRAVEFEQVTKRMEDRSNLGGKRMTEEEYQKYALEQMEFANKMLEKYKTPEQRQKFNELVKKEIEKIKE